jgi:hypothetical protein
MCLDDCPEGPSGETLQGRPSLEYSLYTAGCPVRLELLGWDPSVCSSDGASSVHGHLWLAPAWLAKEGTLYGLNPE